MKKSVLALSDFAVCLILALAFTAAPYYIKDGVCKITAGYIFTVVVFYAIFLFFAYLIRRYLQVGKWDAADQRSPLMAWGERLINSKYAAIKISLIILAFWIVPLVFLYPGTFINDTWHQLQQFIEFRRGVDVLKDHNPIFDTVVMGLFIVPASEMTGEWHKVIFFYVLVQATITSLAFASTVVYSYRKLGLGIRVATGILLVYCLLPIFPAAVQTVSKDALHSWGFVFFMLCFAELVRTNGKALEDRFFLVKLVLTVLYCCLTKKVAYYVIIFSLAAFIIFIKNYRRYALIPLVCAILLMNVVMPAVITGIRATPGGKQEMLSLPFQMTARYVKYYGDDITEEEYKVLDKVLIMDTLAESYLPTNADPVKGYSQRAEDHDYIDYLKVWAKQGLRHPNVYISAFNCMAAGWFSWYECIPLMNNDWRSALITELIPEWVAIRGFSEKTARGYEEMAHNLHGFPIIKIPLSYGFYSARLPAFAVCTTLRRWKKKDAKYWLAVLPIAFCVVLGCWLAPVSIHFEGKRYLYPIIYSAPLLAAWCMYVYKENRE